MAKHKLQGVRVAVLAADGVEQVELTKPVEELKDQGAEVEIISLRPGSIQAMNAMVPGKKIDVDRTIFTANPNDYDALLLPGGHFNPDFLRQSESVLDFVREIDHAGKPIAVICHGPWTLISAGLVHGRRLTSWPGIRDDVLNAGGIWKDAAVVHDGNWISSRDPKDIPKFNDAMVELFTHRTPTGDYLEEDGGGMGLGTLLASGLALAAIGFGVRQLQGSGAFDSFGGGSGSRGEGSRETTTGSTAAGSATTRSTARFDTSGIDSAM
ncbi:MAG: type 1 glutamine amidotransferase [Gemmatimonadetes bacterium]|nr:type 1 glutamine amidotransferase [Gemmatimonadota bacterium]